MEEIEILDHLFQAIYSGNYFTAKKINESKHLTAKMLINQMRLMGVYPNIQDVEFKVYSQFGEDGIIQYLIHHIDIKSRNFIEFGVQNYEESNTRFLLTNNNWSGLVIDSDKQNTEYIQQDEIYWRQDLTAITSFITTKNINEIITNSGFSGELGILSIDIDGNDYWIWEAIDVVSPTIVVVEYNSLFGSQNAISIPYEEQFTRSDAHFSTLYFGASLKALCILAKKKGYAFVGSNSSGCNAFFVRQDKLGEIPELTPELGYVKFKFRQARDQSGNMTYLSFEDSIKLIQDMPVYDIESDRLAKIEDYQFSRL
jgi:hypothetical protein